jgi:hypothetical protein
MDNRHTRQIITPPPLAADRTELLASRISGFDANINDLVDAIHIVLFDENPLYKRYLYAVHDSQAVTGALVYDNSEAIRIIKEYAIEKGIEGVKDENLATIGKAMNVVLRRFGQSRKQRRNMVRGEVVPDDNGND